LKKPGPKPEQSEGPTTRYHDPDIPRELFNQAKALAARRGWTMKHWVRTAIKEKIERDSELLCG